MRCLLPKTLLENGFFPMGIQKSQGTNQCKENQLCSYSWSGQRKTPSYANKLVFPEKFMTALRTIAMQEDEIIKVSSLLEEVRFLVNLFFPPPWCLRILASSYVVETRFLIFPSAQSSLVFSPYTQHSVLCGAHLFKIGFFFSQTYLR